MTIDLAAHGYRRALQAGLWLRGDESAVDFGYNDGDEYETWVGQTVRGATDVSTLSRELGHGIRDWPSRYHLSPQRGNIVQPLFGTIAGPVLEIGAGMGAVTRALGEQGHEVVAVEGSPRRATICADRCRDLDNVQVVADTIQGFGNQSQFGTVVMIGVLEYSRVFGFEAEGLDPVDVMLRHVSSLLAPGGQLILAIENQLGLKYFAGFPEDHVGRRMFGIEDRYGDDTVVTFGREELARHLTGAGLAEQEWYYPFPDYKLPTTVISDRALVPDSPFDPSPLVASSAWADHQRPATTSFELERAWHVAARNGLVADLANSFLVRASATALTAPEPIAWYYGTSSRRPEFAKSTTFEPAGGGLVVRRHPALATLPTEVGTIGIRLTDEPYHAGHPWTATLADIVGRAGWDIDQLTAWFGTWFTSFCATATVPGPAPSGDVPVPSDLIDALPRNLIVDGDATEFIDLEWYSTQPCPLSYAVFRALYDSLASLGPVAPPAEGTSIVLRGLVVELAARHGIELDVHTLREHWEREAAFQSTVLGSTVPVAVEQALDVPLTLHRDLDAVIHDAESLGAIASELEVMRAQAEQQAQTEAGLRAEIERVLGVDQHLRGERDAAVATLRGELEALERTVSWRVTRPLRVARRLARRPVSFVRRVARQPARVARAMARRRAIATMARPDAFDVAYYRRRHTDLQSLTDDDLRLHYQAYGRAEGRLAQSVYGTSRKVIRSIDPERETVLVVFHDATRTGAPVLGWNLVREIGRLHNVIAVLEAGGELATGIEELASATVTLDPTRPFDEYEADLFAAELRDEFHPLYAIANSAATHPLAPALEHAGVPVVGLVHEFASSMRPNGVLHGFFESVSEVVFSAEIVADSMRREYISLLARKHHTIAQGQSSLPPGGSVELPSRVTRRGTDDVDADLPERSLDDFLADLDPGTLLVIGAGTIAPRKGIEFFVQTAEQTRRIAPGTPIAFAWIGHRIDSLQWYVEELWEQVERSGARDRVTFLAPAPDLEALYARSDVFFLSSRLDPMPNVTIDAALAGVPVVAFEKASGFADWLQADQTLGRLVVPHLDVAAAATVIAELAADPGERERYGAALRAAARTAFDMPGYVAKLDDLGLSARAAVDRAAADIAEITASGEFSPHLFAGADTYLDTVALVSRYVNASRLAAPRARPRSGLLVRRPTEGFNPLVYAEQAPGYDDERDGDPFADYLRKGKPSGPWVHGVLRPADPYLPLAELTPLRVLVHGHFHYPELVDELVERLAVNEVPVTVHLTTTSDEKAAEITRTLEQSALTGWQVQVVPNRGRDLAPLLAGIGMRAVNDFDLLLHVHGKRSPHVDSSISERWRDFLWENLVGGRSAMLDRIHAGFATQPTLGLAFPEDPHLNDWDLNRADGERLAVRLGITAPLPNHFDFPVGDMYWARTDAIRPLFEAGFQWHEFPEEPLPIDGTMLHALERLTPFVVAERGYAYAKTVVPGVSR